MPTYLKIVFIVLGTPIFLYCLYFVIIGLFGLRRQNRYTPSEKKHRFCAVIAARNEAVVIGNLIDCILAQNYPKDLLDVYVIPNNCTDNTEEVALAHGAKIFHCTDAVRSKGDALRQFFHASVIQDEYDVYSVFDADNLVDPNFFHYMNDAYADGVEIAQGYRDSKNPKDTWMSGCQSIFYWIVNRFLNFARYSIGLSAILNGTGYMVSASVLKEMGFNTFSLTEDIEYTTQCIIKGRRVGWVPQAMVYDEHPLDFGTSWNQRKRWSTGTIQCCKHYIPALWQRYKEEKSGVYLDMMLYLIAPYVQVITFIYSILSVLLICFFVFTSQTKLLEIWQPVVFTAIGLIGSIIISFLIVKLEGHEILQVKSFSFFTFWWYIISWIFINIDSFANPTVKWDPIAHTKDMKLSDVAVSGKR